MEDQGIDCQIVGLHDLLYKAIDFESGGTNGIVD